MASVRTLGPKSSPARPGTAVPGRDREGTTPPPAPPPPPAPQSSRWRTIAAVAAIVVLLALAWWRFSGGVKVQTAPVTTGDAAEVVYATGNRRAGALGQGRGTSSASASSISAAAKARR